MNNEKAVNPVSGWIGILTTLLCLTFAVIGILNGYVTAAILLGVSLFVLIGSVIVAPNEACVLIFFGRYAGTIKKNGFFWISPLSNRKTVSLKPQHFTSRPILANDISGNPIIIGLVLVWKVEDTYKAAFEVDDYIHFVMFQCDAALLKLSDHYPYDNFDIKDAEYTLIAGGDVVNKFLEQELSRRLHHGGIGLVEARINYVAYGSKGPSAKRKKKQNGDKTNGNRKE